MRGRPTTFWGKLEQDASKVVITWHPLLAHCADVAACAEALLEQTLLRQRLAALAGRQDLDAVDIARLSVLAALHDIGKFNLGFQRKADAEPRDPAGHVAEVLDLCGSGYPEEKLLMASFASELARAGSPAQADAGLLKGTVRNYFPTKRGLMV